jgi:predicted small metal-binding protein
MTLPAKRNLVCPCGKFIQGKDEDDLVVKALEHLREEHPELADSYSREDILLIAY